MTRQARQASGLVHFSRTGYVSPCERETPTPLFLLASMFKSSPFNLGLFFLTELVPCSCRWWLQAYGPDGERVFTSKKGGVPQEGRNRYHYAQKYCLCGVCWLYSMKLAADSGGLQGFELFETLSPIVNKNERNGNSVQLSIS